MSAAVPLPDRLGESVFRDDEFVTASMAALLPGAVQPCFGSTTVWDVNGVLRRPANVVAANWKVVFNQPDPIWNLRIREIAMIGFNPRHEVVVDRGIHLPPDPKAVSTIAHETGYLRDLSDWAIRQGLPGDLSLWIPEHVHRYLQDLRDRLKRNSLRTPMTVIRKLYLYGPVLAGGGLNEDPWGGRSNNSVLDLASTPELTTEPIAPESWFPLIRAAWTYINVFSHDILRAHTYWQAMKSGTRKVDRDRGQVILQGWLCDPANRVPVHNPGDPESVNWSLLTTMTGLDRDTGLFRARTSGGRQARALVLNAAREGRYQSSLLNDLQEVDRPDGSRGPWHEALSPTELWYELATLRNACYVFVAALSMMRDSELREIAKGAVVEHYGSPAVVSLKRKKDPDIPAAHWWITEPVAQAISMASQLSQHRELVFSAVRNYEDETLFDSRSIVKSFIERVNKTCQYSGLDPISAGQRVNPHMFRRTMAMLTRDFPGAEIAVGMQLKHAATRALANRVTPGYYSADTRWDAYFDDALASSRFQRLSDLYDTHRDGGVIGYGPGADRMRTAFDTVAEAADTLRANGQARHGDRRVEYELLRKTRFSIRFGKLNHCTMDDSNPAGAKCIEDAIVPEGHRGPLIDRCQPGRCANSIIAPEQLPIWSSERGSLVKLLETPNIPPGRREALQLQIDQVDSVLRKAAP
ncbi:site-specific integrase [Streptomyces acidiscabies]|uniref:site-specific integrase n=1 Tax=Streptomyces acidiscabies TaxID=42234 RepID=UPI00095D9C89|nr:site-specific integrase [Streptomyces acidiscabies]GAV46227.1 hypothetical protein Saa2_09229 [Streptomyces acidiscabies]